MRNCVGSKKKICRFLLNAYYLLKYCLLCETEQCLSLKHKNISTKFFAWFSSFIKCTACETSLQKKKEKKKKQGLKKPTTQGAFEDI